MRTHPPACTNSVKYAAATHTRLLQEEVEEEEEDEEEEDVDEEEEEDEGEEATDEFANMSQAQLQQQLQHQAFQPHQQFMMPQGADQSFEMQFEVCSVLLLAACCLLEGVAPVFVSSPSPSPFCVCPYFSVSLLPSL